MVPNQASAEIKGMVIAKLQFIICQILPQSLELMLHLVDRELYGTDTEDQLRCSFHLKSASSVELELVESYESTNHTTHMVIQHILSCGPVPRLVMSGLSKYCTIHQTTSTKLLKYSEYIEE